MRICLVADATSIHTKRWASWFAQNGHDVHIVSFWDAEIKGVTVHHIKLLPSILISLKNSIFRKKKLALSEDSTPTQKARKGFGSTLMSYFTLISQPLDNWRVRRAIKRIKPDILHGHYVTNYGFHAACSGFHPLVITAWGSDVLIDPGLSRFNRHRVKFALKKADVITCTSRYLYDAILQYAQQNSIIKIIPFGIDLDAFKPPKKHRNHLRITIGTTKGFKPIYGMDYLIKSIPYILAKHKDIKVLIAGSGDQTSHYTIAKNLKVENVVQFVGEIPHNAVPEYLSKIDIFVMPSLSESFGVAALEAQAVELPVIATNVGGIPEVVKDGETGFLVKPRNPEEIARAVMRLIDDSTLRKQMGENGRKFVAEHYNWNENASRMEALYSELVYRH